MNKNVLKNFAINARLELLARVRDRATLYGITDEKIKNNKIVASNAFQKIDGQLLSKNEIAQRNALLQRIQTNGYVQVMEEAAYTWFNRFIAIKYMEVHKLLPVDQRVIPQQAGELPQLVREAQNVALNGIDFSAIVQYLDSNRTEELYKYLVIALCNQLSGCLPQMFEKISDYTELLFPDGLMKADSFLGMLANVDDENWQEIQVIGWLYQYYNTDLKNETFDLLKKNVKITKDRIGAATQLFTPEWIVRYMVENSLGRLWYEGHPDDNLKLKWRYYLDEAKQEPDVEKQLTEIRKEREKLQPEAIKIIDPCMGSGHILVYAFDVLMDIYRSVGYTDRDAVQSIIQNNIYGLDIDDRAAQLAYFALMMKAAEYDTRFLKRNVQPNVLAIQESNSIVAFSQLREQISLDSICLDVANQLISCFVDAKEYGSILTPNIDNLCSVDSLMEQLEIAATNNLEISAWYEQAKRFLPRLAKQAIILQQLYDISITNPPYMTNGSMSDKLSKYVQKKYENTRRDLYTVFIERCMKFTKSLGYQSMITQQSWLFINSYETLRKTIIDNKYISTMVQLGPRAFEEISGEVVQTVAFVINNCKMHEHKGTYIRLVDYDDPWKKQAEFENNLLRHLYITKQSSFDYIPKNPIAFWLKEETMRDFSNFRSVGDDYFMCYGLLTGHDEGYIFSWPEVKIGDILFNCHSVAEFKNSGLKYAPLCKGGLFRRWYGNYDLVVRYDEQGIAGMSQYPKYASNGQDHYFEEGITWAEVCMGHPSMRYMTNGNIFSLKSPSIFERDHEKLLCLLGFLNTKVASFFVQILNPTISCGTGVIGRLLTKGLLSVNTNIVEKNIAISRADWDSFETSWDFQVHPLIAVRKEIAFGQFAETRMQDANKLEKCFAEWETQCGIRFDNLKKNEEELNRIFIDIYGLGEELTPDIAEKDITVRKADLGRDIRSLISYAVGCMFGRYSLDAPGLAYAGGDWDSSKYVTYPADRDGILPITDDEYFQDDIVSMFVRWVKTVYGEETLEENLQFIANALNLNGGTSREVIRSYFLNDFYSDHLKIYQKRPIYWQFDSGKQNGFKALMYLHRYDQDTVARLRTDYVHELQDRYRTQLEDARKTAESGDARQRSAANKRAQKLDKQLTELNKYEELVHHYADMRIPLDLDDGVIVNYAKLQDILTKIK